MLGLKAGHNGQFYLLPFISTSIFILTYISIFILSRCSNLMNFCLPKRHADFFGDSREREGMKLGYTLKSAEEMPHMKYLWCL